MKWICQHTRHGYFVNNKTPPTEMEGGGTSLEIIDLEESAWGLALVYT